MSDYQEHIAALRVLIVSGAVRGRTVEYSGDEALAMTDHLNAIETALAAERAKTAKLVEAGDFAKFIGTDTSKDDKDLVLVTYGMLRQLRAAITEAGHE